MENEKLISHHSVFSSLDKATLQKINDLAVARKLGKGEFLVHQGEIWPFLFLVKQGAIAAEKDSEDGRTLVAATIGKGELFWGLAFFLGDASMPAAFRVIENAEVLLWSRNDLLSILQQNGSFAWELGKLAVQRMLLASEVLESMTFHPIAVRLARLLVGISKDEVQNPIERSMTLDEMAARIGSTREMVCRLLYRFSDEGLIKITRTEFTVVDTENLHKRAQN